MQKLFVCAMELQIFLKKGADMNRVFFVLLLSCAYASVQQMVIADAATPVKNDSSVVALAAGAKDEMPPELKASLLRDLQHKEPAKADKFPAGVAADYSTPHASNSAVLAWANEAMVATFSYDFLNIEKAKQTASNYYTPNGWSIMANVHNEIGDETMVIKEQLAASAVAISPPKIIQQNNIANRYSWLVEMPVLLTLAKSGQIKSSKVLARFLVVRDNPQVHDRGLAINNIAIKKI